MNKVYGQWTYSKCINNPACNTPYCNKIQFYNIFKKKINNTINMYANTHAIITMLNYCDL